MKRFVPLLMLHISPHVTGQEFNKYDKCPGEMIFVKAERMPVFKKSVDSLKVFFAASLSSVGFENANGTILLEIIICTKGSATLQSMTNKTDIPCNEQAVKDMISKMPLWKPGFQNGRLVDCVAMLELNIIHGILSDFRYKNYQ